MTYRMETPILEELPQVLLENEDYIAVNKPSSMPVHPCGNFCYNTLSKIMEHEMEREGLLTVHRLDRQTSGIVFFAKNAKASDDFRVALNENKVSKVYFARV
jgi:23S rRNA-/tRNA-specific pseudouridylate synthase